MTDRTETPLREAITWWMRAMAAGTRALLAGLTRIRIEGDVRAIPLEGPVIVAANHASNLDPVVLASSVMPRSGRRWQWLGKKELFAWPIVGWIASHGGVHPVDRSTADVEAYRLAKRILDEGHALFVFPEGTRSRDGALQRARDGVAVLALRTGAPIVPIGVAGSYDRWPRGQKLPHPGGRVTVRVGAPFRVADELPPGLDRKAATPLATDLIMRRIAELLPPEQRGVYGEPATTSDPAEAAPTPNPETVA
jgi:1-acyl-sn-glycerol-3-phosphate acyltransferase